MTVRDDILEAIRAALFHLADEFEIEPVGDPNKFPSLSVFDGGHMVLEREGGITRRAMLLTIDGYVEGCGGWEPTQQRNALQADVVKALLADPTLGGIVELIEDTDLRMATATLASKRRLMFAQDFEIQFVTHRVNPALAG